MPWTTTLARCTRTNVGARNAQEALVSRQKRRREFWEKPPRFARSDGCVFERDHFHTPFPDHSTLRFQTVPICTFICTQVTIAFCIQFQAMRERSHGISRARHSLPRSPPDTACAPGNPTLSPHCKNHLPDCRIHRNRLPAGNKSPPTTAMLPVDPPTIMSHPDESPR